jgi:hypothetical protein
MKQMNPPVLFKEEPHLNLDGVLLEKIEDLEVVPL